MQNGVQWCPKVVPEKKLECSVVRGPWLSLYHWKTPITYPYIQPPEPQQPFLGAANEILVRNPRHGREQKHPAGNSGRLLAQTKVSGDVVQTKRYPRHSKISQRPLNSKRTSRFK